MVHWASHSMSEKFLYFMRRISTTDSATMTWLWFVVEHCIKCKQHKQQRKTYFSVGEGKKSKIDFFFRFLHLHAIQLKTRATLFTFKVLYGQEKNSLIKLQNRWREKVVHACINRISITIITKSLIRAFIFHGWGYRRNVNHREIFCHRFYRSDQKEIEI